MPQLIPRACCRIATGAMVGGRHLSSPMRYCPQLRAESLSATMSRAEERTVGASQVMSRKSW